MCRFFITRKKNAFIIFLTLYLLACTQQISKPENMEYCLYSNQDIAPGWVCGKPFSGLAVQAVGVADKSAAGLNYMYDKASLAAMKRLTEVFEQNASISVIQYLVSINVQSAKTIKAGASVINSISTDTLTGAKQYQSEIGPVGRAYVLVGVDENAYIAILETVVKTSMENDQLLWESLQTGQSFDELANAISRYQFSE